MCSIDILKQPVSKLMARHLTYPHHQPLQLGVLLNEYWVAKTEDDMEAFALLLSKCASNNKNVIVQKEKIWKHYYTLRATKEFSGSFSEK